MGFSFLRQAGRRLGPAMELPGVCSCSNCGTRVSCVHMKVYFRGTSGDLYLVRKAEDAPFQPIGQ